MRTSSVLPRPGTPSKQAVPADEQARQHAVHDVVVPDDHPADLLLDRRIAIAKLLRLLLHRLADTHEGSSRCGVQVRRGSSLSATVSAE